MVPFMDDKTDTQAKAGAMIVPVTLFEQNCTIIWHEPSKKAVVIDPGGDVPKILEAIKQTGVTVEKIWLTHGHIDHVGGAADLRDALDLDSMDFLNFVIALHGSLGVDVPEGDYVKLATLNGAVDYLAGRLNG